MKDLNLNTEILIVYISNSISLTELTTGLNFSSNQKYFQNLKFCHENKNKLNKMESSLNK